MSPDLAIRKLSTPSYYHREYKNDIGKKAEVNSLAHQCQRVALVALPFFSLYKPLSLPLSLAMGGLRTFTSVMQLLESIKQGGNAQDIPYNLLQTTIAVVALAGTIFAHPLGMVISTIHDLTVEVTQLVYHLKKGEYGKAMGSYLGIVNNALYLTLFLHGGLEIAVASLVIQGLTGLYHSQAEFRKGHYIEGLGHLLMSIIRGNQLVDQSKILQTKWQIQDALSKMKERKPNEIQRSVRLNCQNGISSLLENHSSSVSKNTKLTESSQNSSKETGHFLLDALIRYGNNNKGIPALHFAVDQGDAKAVSLLLQHGASPNALAYRCTDWEAQLSSPLTPLDYAAKNGDVNMLTLLLDSGAHLNLIHPVNGHKYQWTPALNFASQFNQGEAVNFLISRGAIISPNTDIPDMFPIYVATKNGSINSLKALVQSGADVRVKLPYSQDSLLHVAVEANQPNIIKFLLNHGVDIDARTLQTGNTALHEAIIHKKMEAAEELLKNKANVNALNNWKWTPLMSIFEYSGLLDGKRDLQRVRLLIENGAGLEFRDDQGRTAFRRLMERYLWGSGGNCDFNNDGEFTSMVNYFAQKGVDVNARDDANHTLLFYAKQTQRQNVIKWLLGHKATE